MVSKNVVSSPSAGNETTPLLSAPSATPAEDQLLLEAQLRSDEDEKPLPKAQIFMLCYARIVEPIAFFSIFSFINQMIWETGNLKEADVGFYSGLIVGYLVG